MSYGKKLRWTPQEMDNVTFDWNRYEDGTLTTGTLKAAYQGRSIPAIREKVRWLTAGMGKKEPKVVRLNPVYAAVEARMIALGYGPEIIKSIISPRKTSIPTSLIRDIETLLSATPNGAGWFHFSTNGKGAVKATFLKKEQDMAEVEALA